MYKGNPMCKGVSFYLEEEVDSKSLETLINAEGKDLNPPNNLTLG